MLFVILVLASTVEPRLLGVDLLFNFNQNTVSTLEWTPLWRWTFGTIFNRLLHHTPGPDGIASLDPQTVLQYLTLCVATIMRP